MKHYIEIAKQYFHCLEGLQLYPSPKTVLFWLWVLATAVWIGGLVYFFTHYHALSGANGIFFVLFPELIWIGVTLRVSSWKARKFVDATNVRLGTSFKSVADCRYHVLCSVMKLAPSEFLKAAKEIDDLLSLQRKFRKYSDLTFSEFWRNIYDKDSKARLLALVIALVSMTVALAVKSNATLETVFDIYAEPSWRDFLVIIAFIVFVAFFAFIGLRFFILTIVDGLAAWSVKIIGSSMYSEWLLAHLVRDLAFYHGKVMEVSKSDENLATSDNATLVVDTHLPVHGLAQNE